MSCARARTALRSTVGFLLAALTLTLAPALATARSAPPDSRTLRTGMRGDDVRRLQIELGRVGLRTPATGCFGIQTSASLRSFQVRFGLPVTGVATPRVQHILSLVLMSGSKKAVADLSRARGDRGGSGPRGPTDAVGRGRR